MRPITKVVPYVSVGAGLAGYKPSVTLNNGTVFPAYKVTEFILPVGAGLKFNLSNSVNLDLGYKMYFVDGDNLDATRRVNNHKDRFSYSFVGLEFELGGKNKSKLMLDNLAI